MLKTATGKLYTLLAACKPDDARVHKRLLITEILERPEYRALQVYQGAASVMDDYYSPYKLKAASYEQLQEINKIIPFLEECIRKLYDAICYGDVRELGRMGEIDFYNSASMHKLFDIVKDIRKDGINITNISEYDVWAVFDKNTVLSLNSKIELFDLDDVEVLETQVTNKLSDCIYCISAKEIAEKRHAYRDLFRKKETVRLRLQIVENKVFVKKACWSLLSILMVMTQYQGSAGVFSGAGSVSAFVIYSIALIAYWVLG